jgi:phenylalanyl-tRNA synthetase beta chain
MKFTLSWLKKFLDTNLSVAEISEKLTSIGLEVEEIIDRAADLKDFTVAKILEATQHPNADSLRLCKVDTGSEILQIVCGAPNAREGIKVVLAKIGALIPNGEFKIKASSIRGVESNGMLCSETELMIGSGNDGIIELPEDAALGEQFAQYYGIGDVIFDISVTPNRADCLGVYGIARDLAAAGAGKFVSATDVIPAHAGIQLNILDPRLREDDTHRDLSACFITRQFNNIKNQESPKWLQNLLKAIGKEPISALVDITNYICLSFAKPLHVYDADKIKGELSVDYAKDSEKIKALDGKEYILQSSDIVIHDELQVVGVAGIMGGKDSAVSMETTNVILESAIFDRSHIAKTGRRLMIDSDARYRFERGIDQNFVLPGLLIASKMIEEICGGSAAEVSIIGHAHPENRNLTFDCAEIEKRLGIKIPQEKVEKILQSLGFEIKSKDAILSLSIPSWRNDIAIKEDIIEEVIRIYGLDKLSNINLPHAEKVRARFYSKLQRMTHDFRRISAFRGFDEVVTWSFISSFEAKLFAELDESLYVANPISIDLDYMRPSILPNFFKIAKLNQDRGLQDQALFEVGPIFASNYPQKEKTAISAIRSGNFSHKTPLETERTVDFYDIKSDLEALLSDVGFNISKLQITKNAPSYYHPGKSAVIHLGKNLLGYFGEIHPKILKYYDLAGPIVAFELILSDIPESKLKFGKKSEYFVSGYQAVSRDFAFIMPIVVQASEIEKLVMSIDNKLIKKFEIFDIYQGNKIEAGYKSVAFNILLQADDRTLIDEEMRSLSDKIIGSIEVKFAAKLRS